MGTALSVFKIISIDNKFKKYDYLNTTSWQEKLDKFNINIEGELTSDIILKRKKISIECKIDENIDENNLNDILLFEVTHYSEVHKEPIRIFIDEIIQPKELFVKSKKIKPNTVHEFSEGYQNIYYYDVMFDFKENEIYVFAPKDISKRFVNYFKELSVLKYEVKNLKLEKVPSIPEIQNIFGAWEDIIDANIKTKAIFGTQIHESKEINFKDVSSWNLEWMTKSEDIKDLFINKDSRLSSRSKINYLTLLDIYKRLKEYIGFIS